MGKKNKPTNIDFDKIFIILFPALLLIATAIFKEETYFLVVSLLVCIFFYELVIFKYRLIYGLNGLRILSIPSLVFFTYTLLIAIPSITVYLSETHPNRFLYFFSILCYYIIVPLSYRISFLFSPIKINLLHKNFLGGFKKSKLDIIGYEILLIMFSISVGILFIYLLRVDRIPLFEIFSNKNAYLALEILREKSMKLLDVSIFEKYLFSWQREIILPFGILGSLFLAAQYNRNKYKILFLLFLLMGIFNNSLTVAKMPTASIIFSLCSFYFIYRQRINFKFVLISLIVIFIFPIFIMYVVSIPGLRSPEIIFTALLNRIFVIPAAVLFQYFKIFPSMHSFLYGKSTNLFSWLYSEGNFKTANYVAKIWWQEPNTTGSANAVYLGNFWADFGIAGVIFSTLFVAFFLHYFYLLILRSSNYSKNIIYITLTTGLVGTFTFNFISTSVTILFITKGLIFVIILLILQNLFFGRLVKESNSIKTSSFV